ncbi:phosphatidate cytidylyltransferase [Frigidibacter albus]|uniref:Phosphatidate cytidylyltransferase n=1 Tax=Frigidibacter albus TaxID=1465486 RepID=A0A6L8VEC1_9RHOB|nr:phosphatidate cytidylyltransferase [Frigidibacter albus]MZQ88046.1 phosphatidate cytidylyltransferase [Frigidibacter albus]NBE30280.1 phosphatidate cytidylyltransferase [Frigidibacter albus]GGH47812.1 phosphatidate cytidylyltransferase [Frigidibacter albus]
MTDSDPKPTPSRAARWADLGPRLISGLVMAGGGLVLIWAGGWWFAGLAIVAAGLMVWELAAMLAAPPGRAMPARGLGLLAGGGLLAALVLAQVWPGQGGGVGYWGWGWGGLLLLLPALASPLVPMRDRLLFVLYSLAVLQAAYGLVSFRADHGVLWLAWLVAVVVVTDIAGYFAGKAFGGPKFWPRISPKKTWSGTVAGWIGAALVGLAFGQFTTAGPDLPWISAALALAAQMGDIAESAIKRRAGVKDSSRLIPGHGGLLDRFDGLLGAALLMLLVAQVVDVPVVRF